MKTIYYNISTNFLLFVLITVILNSCVPAYVPNVVNSPLLSNKGEFQTAVHTGTAGNDPQIAYAITENIGIMLNGSFANRTSDSTSNFHTHKFIELGTGYFNNFNNNGRYEIFGGFGMGSLKADYANNLWSSYADVTINRIFLQPSVGIVSDIVDFSLSSRLVLLNMNYESSRNTGLFIEPVITGKIGYKYVKLVYQFGLSFPLNPKSIDFTHQPLLLSIGLQGFIGKNHK